MAKNRGFKPQGVINPIARIKPSGPSMIERVQRESRPTWEQLKKLVKKKEASSSEAMEKWENENYQLELAKLREEKRSAQEKHQLAEIKREAKRCKKLRKSLMRDAKGGPTDLRLEEPSEDSSDASSAGSRLSNRRLYSKVKLSISKKRHSHRDRKRHKKHRAEKETSKQHPHKLSDFFKLSSS